ncbi:uncharacterized protein [Gossypium hirsutum]|uniref:RNA-directed DNA polymerase homolog n=1 Tax=Gossypium hirsutum TaxID=3635 RepID=A0ABM2ZPJ1_GOSHI|nr:uncharacterized protein LOC121214536 [Gossypium hirsutum]
MKSTAVTLQLADRSLAQPEGQIKDIKLEDEGTQSIEQQRRLNEKIKKVFKKEIITWLDAGIIYLISDSNWASPVQCVPKKVASLWYNQIAIALKDQEKTTFTYLFGTFAFYRMPFGLCNVPATFQRCMIAIFLAMIEDSLGVLMDDFSVYGNDFDHCADNMDKILK